MLREPWYSITVVHSVGLIWIEVGAVPALRRLHQLITGWVIIDMIDAKQKWIWCIEWKSHFFN